LYNKKTEREAAMRQFMMTVAALAAFGAMVATAQTETPSPGQVPSDLFGYSDWATGADYQKLFNAMVRQQRYPRVVQVAQVRNVLSTFRAITASPLIALFNGMIGFVEPDSGLCINNLSN
jgi:hypothetical protein